MPFEEAISFVDTTRFSPALRSDLRTDHAGETGAVWIYRGILAISRDEDVRAFAKDHLETEAKHLQLMDALVPKRERTRLTPVWKLAGWLTGALPALFGAKTVFATIDAVETFVDEHYTEQIDRMLATGEEVQVREVLERCRDDEIDHRDDARARGDGSLPAPLKAWCAIVGAGSKAAVSASRLI